MNTFLSGYEAHKMSSCWIFSGSFLQAISPLYMPVYGITGTWQQTLHEPSCQLTACHLQELFDLIAFDTIMSFCTIFSREQSICTQNEVIIKIKFQTRDKNEYSLFLAFTKSTANEYSLLISLFLSMYSSLR